MVVFAAVSVAIFDADFISSSFLGSMFDKALVSDNVEICVGSIDVDCFKNGNFESVGCILWYASSFNRLAVDVATSANDSFTRSPVFKAVLLADCFRVSPILVKDLLASHADCSPFSFALIFALVIEWRMFLVASVVTDFALLAATSMASMAARFALSDALDIVSDAVNVRELAHCLILDDAVGAVADLSIVPLSALGLVAFFPSENEHLSRLCAARWW